MQKEANSAESRKLVVLFSALLFELSILTVSEKCTGIGSGDSSSYLLQEVDPAPPPLQSCVANMTEACLNANSAMPTPLQIALWNGNLEQIQECLKEDGPEALETRDARGNRALHLALKFSHRDAAAIVKALLDAGARVRSRDSEGWKAIHHAVVTENEEILRVLARREKEQAPALLQQKIDSICPRLADVPDFYSEMLVDVSTWIPGVSRWLPSDTVKIWKAGQDVRFDVTLVGFENGKWDRGDLSFLLLGSQGKFICLDNQAKTCTNLLGLDTKLSETELDQMVHFLMTTSIVTTDLDASNVTFERKCAWFSSEPMLEDIGCWKDTRVVDMIGVEASLRFRKPYNPSHPPPTIAIKHPAACDAVSLLTEAGSTVDQYTDVVVNPNSKHVVSVEVAKGEELTWKFTTRKRDIDFGVRFREQESGEKWEQVVPLHRTRAHVNEVIGSFTASSAGTAVLTWDNSHSVIRSKRLRFAMNQAREKDQGLAESRGWDARSRAKEEEISFTDWFGVAIESLPDSLRALRPHRCVLAYAQPSCRKITKSFPATVYMSDQFPLSVSEFLPVIEVLSRTTSAFESVQTFFSAAHTDGLFPVQFCFPLVPSVSATFRFDRIELQAPDARKFVVPSSYSMRGEDLLSPRTHQVVLQRLTAT
uniref:GOLD domain-containing protein n=1 Tax=Peronospora matthiolae TaxID=2874970 RepID=A0AAV1TNW2_9STRA